jgi:putative oxidoreductase
MPIALASRRTDIGLLVLRLALAGVVLFHGVFKITHGVEWIKGPLAHFGLPGALAYGTYVAEVGAPLFLIAGAWTRIAALVIAFDMAMAMTIALRGRVFTVSPQGGGWGAELEGLILFVAVALAVMGGGRWAVVPD